MKILHVQSYFIPGMGYQENCLPAAQARLGHEVVLLTADRYPPYEAYNQTMGKVAGNRVVGPGRERIDGVDIVRLPCPFEWQTHWWMYLKGLWAAIDAERPDVVHVHGIVKISSIQFYLGNMQRHYPYVVDEHNNYFNIMPYTWKKWLFYAAFKHLLRPVLLREMGRALPMSHEVRTLLDKEFGVPESVSTLSFLGANPERFKRDPEMGRKVRSELGLPEDAVVAVHAGKITRIKDVDVLIEGAAEVMRECPRLYLLLIGNAPESYRRELDTLIDRHSIRERVRWVDFLKNEILPEYYSAADIGIWPGDWSATVIEAAACSLALILPDKEYARYSLMNDNGLTFTRGDARSLQTALRRLVTDDALRGTMGARSRELIERDLNWDAIARQTIQVYEECIAQARARRG